MTTERTKHIDSNRIDIEFHCFAHRIELLGHSLFVLKNNATLLPSAELHLTFAE